MIYPLKGMRQRWLHVRLRLAKIGSATTKASIMKSRGLFFVLIPTVLVLLAGCNNQPSQSAADTPPWECIAAKVTIGTNTIDTVVRYNKFNGEAQLLNAASFASKATGAQGNIIGWVPLGDLRTAVQELMQRDQSAQQQGFAAPANAQQTAPSSASESEPKNKK